VAPNFLGIIRTGRLSSITEGEHNDEIHVPEVDVRNGTEFQCTLTDIRFIHIVYIVPSEVVPTKLKPLANSRAGTNSNVTHKPAYVDEQWVETEIIRKFSALCRT
jgi:hypothetical protein